MNRRQFVGAVGVTLAWPSVGRSQPGAVPTIGFLHSAAPAPASNANVEAFRKGLRKEGFSERETVNVEYRWASSQFDRLPALAKEFVDRKVAVIVAGGGDVSAMAAKSVTSAIPIVFVVGSDPVQQGIVSSLNRPGGNVTGATFLSVEIRPKMVELLREMLPNAKSIAVLVNPNRPGFEKSLNEVVRPATLVGLTVAVLQAGNEREIESALATLPGSSIEGMLVLSDPIYTNHRELIAQRLRSAKTPSVSWSEVVAVGGLIGYGASVEDTYIQAGIYTGRVLKGEKPADLPVLQPTTFELTLNLNTAKFLGIAVPPTLLARADQVIE